MSMLSGASALGKDRGALDHQGVGDERAHSVPVLMQGLLGPPAVTAPGSWVLGTGSEACWGPQGADEKGLRPAKLAHGAWGS